MTDDQADEEIGATDFVAAAELLNRRAAELFGLEIDDKWGYIKVHETDQCRVFVTRMMFTWRVLDVAVGPAGNWGPRRGWCYDHARDAIAAAQAWNGWLDTEPTGWKRTTFDDRRHGGALEATP